MMKQGGQEEGKHIKCKVGELDKEKGAGRRSPCRPHRGETLRRRILSMFPVRFGKDDRIDHLLRGAFPVTVSPHVINAAG